MEITYYLQYLLIKNGYIIIKMFEAEETIRPVEETRLKFPKLTAPIHYTKNIDLATFLYI